MSAETTLGGKIMKMKKTLSLFLALAMTASMPFAVLATEVDPNMQVSTVAPVDGVWKVANAEELEYAAANADNGNSKILVSNNIELKKPLVINKALELSTEGAANVKISAAQDWDVKSVALIRLDKGANLTVSGAFTFNATEKVSGSTAFKLNGDSTLNLNSNSSITGESSIYIIPNVKGNVNVNGNVSFNSSIKDESSNSKITIKNGIFEKDITSNGALTVAGGKFNGNISANTIESISGGTFNGTITASNKGFISGGTFLNQQKPDKSLLVDGKELAQGGNIADKQQADVGNKLMTAPQTITEDNNYKTVNCTDTSLKAALEKMNVAIADSEFLEKVPEMTNQEALDAYNKANKISLTLDNINDLSVKAKKKLVINAENVTPKGFKLTITPSVTVYVENKAEDKSAEHSSYNVEALKIPVDVTIPLTQKLAALNDFTVGYNGNNIKASVESNQITIKSVNSFKSPFEVLSNAGSEVIAQNTIIKNPLASTAISTDGLSGPAKALAEAVNSKKITFSPPIDVDLSNVNVTKDKAIASLMTNGITADISSDIALRADIKLEASLSNVIITEGSEGFTLNLKATPQLYAVLNGNARNVNEALIENSGIKLANNDVTVTVPLSNEFKKIKATRSDKFKISNVNDISSQTDSVAFKASDFTNGSFIVKAPAKNVQPSGYDKQITVLDGTYIIKNKELIKTDSKNTVKFDESAYIVVVKGGYAENTDAKDVDADDFLTKDDVSKIRMGSVKFEENGKLIDGKISWQAKMIKVDGRNKGVYLIEIPIKKNSGYTGSKDIFGNFELRASKPYYFGLNGSATETKENVNFYVEVDADVKTDTDEIYDGTHVYEFNDMEDDEIILYGGDGTFIVDTRGQGKLVIKTDVKYNEGIEKANPDANYVYYNSNYPTFNRLGYLYLKANRGDKIYKVDRDTGRLTKMSVPYDRDMEAFKIRTRTLGCYVVAEKELDLDRINGIIDPKPVKPPVTPPSVINPPTGAEI